MDDIRNLVDGKYYNTQSDTDNILRDLEEEQDLIDFEKKYLKQLDVLKGMVAELEAEVNDETVPETKRNAAKKVLQPFYERVSYGQYFFEKDYFARKWMLEKVYNDGLFLIAPEAEQMLKMMDEKLYFQSEEYKKKEKLYDRIKMWSMVGLPIFTLIGIPLLSGIICYIFRDSDISNPFAWLLGSWIFGYPFIYGPLSFILGWIVIPLVSKACIFGNSKVRPEVNKELAQSSVAGAATVGMMIAGCLSSKKRK